MPLVAMSAPSHGITPFGDLKYPPSFKHLDYANPDAPVGGKLKLAYTAAFDSLNPFILKGVPAPGSTMLFEPLMKRALDEPQSYYGLIAKSIDLAPNRASADFTLRREARWHDGKEITADDVVFSFETLKEKGHPSFRIIYKPIEKVEKLSKYKVRFHFSDPKNRELPILAASMYVIPKHYYQEHPFDQTTLTPPLGSGPYKVGDIEAGRHIEYERVDEYWGRNLPVNAGHNNFQTIRYDVYRDETVAVEAIKSGNYDLREEYIARNWATAFNIDAVERGELVKVKIKNKIPSGMQAFIFNLRQPKFSDRRVREAIALSMDYEWMNNTLFYGAYDRSYSYFQKTQFMANDLPSDAELALLEPFKEELPEEVFTKVFKNPTTDGSGYPRINLLRAQKLLNDAGWVMRDGVRVNAKSGEALTLEFMMRQRTFEKVVGGMIRNLNKLGIEAKFRYVDDSQYQKRIDDRDFDMISIWWNYGLHFPGNEQVSYWHSSQADVVGANNYSGMHSPAVDALLDHIVKAQTLDELLPASRALDRVLLWENVVIPHWHLGAWRLLYWNYLKRPEVSPSYGLALETWWRDDLSDEETQP
ncbi:MAG: extracellular solute-binding protein [Rickettsiales bacterium]|nr:extracellular solute-binding protein [Rickettsiales bacterium]